MGVTHHSLDLDEISEGSWDDLVATFAYVSNIDPNVLRVTYIDSEQDLVDIGSTRELNDALKDNHPLILTCSEIKTGRRRLKSARSIFSKVMNGVQYVGNTIEENAEVISLVSIHVFLLFCPFRTWW